ncbi:hypothetical protein DM01DRAFT_1338482 [Hesseltinella vesiculosa]|uniref:Uncharacterized protein n=1 Tax=Hesseltinella vesiculosa TaxID=101127 RepID=A0A1X2G9Y9_9FUNG|nr:hypothetical protein DM01DRAFT_1338482 [Hesseltinella vesiculosa]
MTLYTKHAHSCRCGATPTLDGYVYYAEKNGGQITNAPELWEDINAWLQSGPNSPPASTTKANTYACGLTAWLGARAYGGHVLRDQDYQDAGQLLLDHCLYERVLARRRTMDCGLDGGVRGMSFDKICHQVISNRKAAVNDMKHTGKTAGMAKLLLIHSLGYLWVYDSDSLKLLSMDVGVQVCTLARQAQLYEEKTGIVDSHISGGPLDATSLCEGLWLTPRQQTTSQAECFTNQSTQKDSDRANIIQVLEEIPCQCSDACAKRVRAHSYIATQVSQIVRGELSIADDDIDFLHDSWQHLANLCIGCPRDVSALLYSSSSALWLMQ